MSPVSGSEAGPMWLEFTRGQSASARIWPLLGFITIAVAALGL